MYLRRFTALACAASLALALSQATAEVVTFSNGAEGWSIQNAVTIEPTGGNPDAYLYHFQIDTFGVNIANTTSPAFLGDYGAKGPVTVGLDVEVTRIWDFFIGDLSRDLVVEFRNYDLAQGGYPWTSVWYNLGTLSSGMPWTSLSVDILDPTSATLPPGWGGYGDEDPNTFEPILPPGVTYADVLAGVDEVVFTSFVPGYFFGFHNWDFGVDNVRINAVPEPSTWLLAALASGALACLGWKRR